MRTSLHFLSIGFVLLLAACSALKISNDYDPAVDFARYESYDWLDDRPGVADEAKGAMSQYPLIDKRLRQAVSFELSRGGLTEDQVDPDLLVAYHVGADDRIDVTSWGYRYRRGYGGWYQNIDVYPYPSGAIILDLIDAETMELVWRGSAENTIAKKAPPGQTDQRIAEAVTRMFEGYPAE